MATCKQEMDESPCRFKGEYPCQGQRRESEVMTVPGTYSHEPFSGDAIEYKVVEISAKLDMSKKIEKWQSTPAESRGCRLLSNFYEQGYRMLMFRALPVGDFYRLSFDSDDPLHVHKYSKFQGIFRKQLPTEADEKWRLRLKTCSLTNQLSYNWHGGLFSKSDAHFKRVSDCQHILQTINEISQDHGRLVGLEMADFGGQQLEIEQYKAWTKRKSENELPQTEVEIDVFYEVPLHSSPETYLYQTANCLLQASIDGGGFSTKGWEVISCNIKEVFDRFLSTGWKLVDVFPDHAAEQTITVCGFSAKLSLVQNFVWIFEKPKSRENDVTPYFEITMVEHWLRVPGQGKGYKGPLAELDEEWAHIITDMGQFGWEVAGVVETPETSHKGGFVGKLRLWAKMWLFFQRPIQPPSYSTLFSTQSNT